MRTLTFIVAALLVSFAFSARHRDLGPVTSPRPPIELAPVTWTFSAQRIGASQADLIFTARIDADWHIHSQRVRNGGPIPTKFGFEESDAYSVQGTVSEPPAIRREDGPFQMTVGMFEQTAVFCQRVRLWSDQADVKGFVRYMACNATSCIPPQTVEFDITVK